MISVPPEGGSRSQLRVRTAPRPRLRFGPTTNVRLSSSYYRFADLRWRDERSETPSHTPPRPLASAARPTEPCGRNRGTTRSAVHALPRHCPASSVARDRVSSGPLPQRPEGPARALSLSERVHRNSPRHGCSPGRCDRPRDQLADLVLALAAERAVQRRGASARQPQRARHRRDLCRQRGNRRLDPPESIFPVLVHGNRCSRWSTSSISNQPSQ